MSGKAIWETMARNFAILAKQGDADVEWMFDVRRSVRHEWLLSDESEGCPPREYWDLFSAAGSLLPKKGAPHSLFPTKLLAEESHDARWLAALRHANFNVIHSESSNLRQYSGTITRVAAASAQLCRKLARTRQALKDVPGVSDSSLSSEEGDRRAPIG